MSSTLGDTLLDVVVADAQLVVSHDVDVANAQLDAPPLIAPLDFVVADTMLDATPLDVVAAAEEEVAVAVILVVTSPEARCAIDLDMNFFSGSTMRNTNGWYRQVDNQVKDEKKKMVKRSPTKNHNINKKKHY